MTPFWFVAIAAGCALIVAGGVLTLGAVWSRKERESWQQ